MTLALDRPLAELLAASACASAFVDATSHVVACNAPFAALFDAEPQALVGRATDALWREQGAVVHGDEITCAGRVLAREVTPLGDLRWVQLRDVTAAHDPARASAESDPRAAKARFLATMSHELRTPLNAILGTAELLRRGAVLEPERLHASAQRIERNAHALLVMLDDLFDATQIEDGLEVEPVPFALGDLLRHSLDVARDVADARGVALVLDQDPRLPERVLGDVRRLRQILGGLVMRGARVGKGSVVLRARRDDVGPSVGSSFPLRIEVLVESRAAVGAGDAARSAIELLVRIAEAIGARLTCAEAPERFELTLALPLAPSSSSFGRTELRRQAARVSLRGRVLVVDDGPENRELLASLLQAAGLSVDLASSGEEGLALAERTLFDLALVDLRMPGLDGFALRSALDASALTVGETRLPVVAVTADAVAGTRERCIAAGFRDCLYKPIEGDVLLRSVRRQLRRNVLVADDDDDLRALVTAFLEDAGWRVFPAVDGEHAIEQLGDRTVHAIVADLEMPRLDGFGVLGRVREADPRIPVVALTGHRDAETRRRAQAAGFLDVLTKPIEGATLVERLRLLLP